MKENIGVHPQHRTTIQESLICSRSENVNTKVVINIKMLYVASIRNAIQITNRWQDFDKNIHFFYTYKLFCFVHICSELQFIVIGKTIWWIIMTFKTNTSPWFLLALPISLYSTSTENLATPNTALHKIISDIPGSRKTWKF